jgi:hypothetical protein
MAQNTKENQYFFLPTYSIFNSQFCHNVGNAIADKLYSGLIFVLHIYSLFDFPRMDGKINSYGKIIL